MLVPKEYKGSDFSYIMRLRRTASQFSAVRR